MNMNVYVKTIFSVFFCFLFFSGGGGGGGGGEEEERRKKIFEVRLDDR